jgi:hypothetical protein
MEAVKMNPTAWSCVAVLGAAVLFLGAGVWLMLADKMPKHRGFQYLGLVLIISFGTFVAIADGQQVSVYMTIIGTTIGYLFGKDWSTTGPLPVPHSNPTT